MQRNVLVTAGFGAMIALGLTGYGCSSTSNSGGGTGGTGGTTGAGGHASGGAPGTSGGATGSGGAAGTDAGQDSGTTLPICSPAPDDGSQCNSNPTCSKNCGPNIMAIAGKRAQKACTCSGANGTWSCPSAASACVYPPDIDLTCLRLPTPVPACPTTTADGGADAGSGLIRPGMTACEVPSSETCGNVCGSATPNVFSYQDGSSVAKVGYCVCIAGVYQCSSVAEWPTF